MVLKSNSTKAFSGGIVNFAKARLVLASKTSSYVELSTPDLNNNKCLFCEKTTNHDHDIIGKVKFDPKQKSYLVSLIEKKAQKVLDVIPVNVTSNSNTSDDIPIILDDVQKEIISKPKAKFRHVFPESVKDESSAVQYFAKRLLNRSQAAVVTAAVKIENNEGSVHLLNSKPKSLLKQSSNCDKCSNTDFHSFDELQQHHETVHHNAIEIRDISIREESAVKIQDGGADNAVDDENEERGFKCQFCDSIFSNDKERIKHNNEIHVSTTETKLQCPTCLQHFKHLSSFKKHRSEYFKGNLIHYFMLNNLPIIANLMQNVDLQFSRVKRMKKIHNSTF